MPPWNRGYPPAAHVVDYLTAYEKCYDLLIRRPVRIEAVHRDGDLLRLDSATASRRARHVISTTGTWWRHHTTLRELASGMTGITSR
ncbi:hypothetical protein ACIBI3_32115 [Actinomadura luteofluorescens]|uniref:hypothetical protein n=1 Tax=Actinomadura luteofluorescens TaxID=46163 RepID=UPI00347CEC0D